MTLAVLYHDPTSEPSRAVHWFAMEAAVPLELRYTWLTRNEHRSPALLAVNQKRGLVGPCASAPVSIIGSGRFLVGERLFAGLTRLQQWLDRLRGLHSYELTHRAWNVIAPMIVSRLTQSNVAPTKNPGWVADTCERVLGIKPAR